MLRIVQQVFDGSESEVLIEYRHCGTNVARETETCPASGRGGIARYEI